MKNGTEGMKIRIAFLLALVATLFSTVAQDIIFTNLTVTFTNLEGRLCTNVTLVRANLDGIIWRGNGMGMISYTNLDLELLKQWGIPTYRVETARSRARQRATVATQQRTYWDNVARANAAAAQAGAEESAKQKQINDRTAERRAALAQIQSLEAQIRDAQTVLDRRRARASDLNNADPYTGYYVVGGAAEQQKINEARGRLEQMKAAYAEKYGSSH
jgi:hypothetical protein